MTSTTSSLSNISVFEGKRFQQAQFLNDSYGWALSEHTLWKTEDGGQTWYVLKEAYKPMFTVVVEGAPEPTTQQEPPGQYVFDCFQFLNETEGWLLEEDYLLHTSDGGASWQKWVFGEGIIKSFRFSDSKNGWFVGQLLRRPRKKGEVERWHPVIYKTGNGGETWEQVYIGPETRYSLWSIWPKSTTEIWAVGFAILRSEDGGRSWEDVQADEQIHGLPYEIKFIDEERGWIKTNQESDRYLYTGDAGRSWTIRLGTPEQDGLIRLR